MKEKKGLKIKKPPFSKRFTTGLLISLVVGMFALAFGSVPLYRLFCQKTGYGGTLQLATEGARRIENRLLTIRFNADVHRDLPWEFKPLQSSIKVYAGETGLAFYRVKNLSSQPLTGIAIYNVTPDKAGAYFNKIHCFCFEEQIIKPHEEVDMPVQFFIDPDIVGNPDCSDIKTITLSYTFFNVKDPNLSQFLGLPSVKVQKP